MTPTEPDPQPPRTTTPTGGMRGSWAYRHRLEVGAAVLVVGFAAFAWWPQPTQAPTTAAVPSSITTTAPPPAPAPYLGGQGSTTTPGDPSASVSATPTRAVNPLPPAQPEEWRRVATGFATDFTTPGAGLQDWAGRLSQWVSPALADAYRNTDPTKIDTAKLQSLRTYSSSTDTVDTVATYDTGLKLGIRLQLGQLDWRVTVCEPISTP